MKRKVLAAVMVLTLAAGMFAEGEKGKTSEKKEKKNKLSTVLNFEGGSFLGNPGMPLGYGGAFSYSREITPLIELDVEVGGGLYVPGGMLFMRVAPLFKCWEKDLNENVDLKLFVGPAVRGGVVGGGRLGVRVPVRLEVNLKKKPISEFIEIEPVGFDVRFMKGVDPLYMYTFGMSCGTSWRF